MRCEAQYIGVNSTSQRLSGKCVGNGEVSSDP